MAKADRTVVHATFYSQKILSPKILIRDIQPIQLRHISLIPLLFHCTQ